MYQQGIVFLRYLVHLISFRAQPNRQMKAHSLQTLAVLKYLITLE
jgi:hypothetical protein